VLGSREFRIAVMIAKHLESLGLTMQIRLGITGFVGVLKGAKQGPVVALRADMDALVALERTAVLFASKIKIRYHEKEIVVMRAYGHAAQVAMCIGVVKILSGMSCKMYLIA